MQLISGSWGFVLLLSEGAPLRLLMAFPLRGVELISLESKICHYDFNCPSCTQKYGKQSKLVFFFLAREAAKLTCWFKICTDILCVERQCSCLEWKGFNWIFQNLKLAFLIFSSNCDINIFYWGKLIALKLTWFLGVSVNTARMQWAYIFLTIEHLRWVKYRPTITSLAVRLHFYCKETSTV